MMFPLEKIKQESQTLRRELRLRTLGYITGGLGLVAGLAWNEAIRALIDYWLPLGGRDGVMAKFWYAALITAIVVFFGVYLARWLDRHYKEDQA